MVGLRVRNHLRADKVECLVQGHLGDVGLATLTDLEVALLVNSEVLKVQSLVSHAGMMKLLQA